MALPSSYSSILADLNRDVLRAQPTDALQFCANWFFARLESERSSFRQGSEEVSMRDSTPPLSARSLPGEKQVGPPPIQVAPGSGKKPSSSSGGVENYTFGGASPASLTTPRGSTSSGMDIEPSSNNNNNNNNSNNQGSNGSPFGGSFNPSGGSPFSRPSDRAGPASSTSGSRDSGPPPSRSAGGGPNNDSEPSSLFGNTSSFGQSTSSSSGPAGLGQARGSRGPPAPLNLAPRDAPAASRNDDDDSASDSDVEDPRDDPNYNPHATSRDGGGAGTGIPVGYNLGRRTSVSAESLDPNATASALPKTVIPKTASQRARIESSIAENLLFRNLDEDQHKDVLNAMKEVTVQKGTEVIIQGAVGDFFYVVEEGNFEVWVRAPPTHTYAGPGQVATTVEGEEKKVATYGPGGSFGELALMYNAPRAATVVSTSRATMWALDRVTFRSILMEHTSRKRKMYEAFLGEVPILASLTPQERAKIADALEEKVYDEGEKVVVEGEVGKNFYIIESGKAEVSRRRRNSGQFDEEILGSLGKGDYFGELALLNSAPRAATVRATPGQGRLRVATLGEKAFTRLLGPVIDILQRKAQNSYGAGAGAGTGTGNGNADSGRGPAIKIEGSRE